MATTSVDGDVDEPIVDIHCHMVPAAATNAAHRGETWHGVPMGISPSGHLSWDIGGEHWVLPWENPEAGFTNRLAKMDANCVDVQVLSVSPALYWYAHLEADRARPLAEEVNDSIAAAVAAHPTRFAGLAHLPLQDPAAAVTELQRSVEELGLAGAAVPGNVRGLNWDAPELFGVLEAAAGLGAIVFVHPATDVRFPPSPSPYHFLNIIGIPLETTVALASMIFGQVFDRLGDLKVCLAHGGGFSCMGLGRWNHAHRVRPECQTVTAEPTHYAERVWFDSLTHSHTALRFLLDQVGSDRVVLGTDYPADMSQVEPVKWIRAATNLTSEEQRAVLSGNIRALLGDRAAVAEPA